MEYFLFFAGVILVALGFLMEHPRFKEKVTNPMVERGWAIEEQRITELKRSVITAREDVASLLVELERASETVVQSMEAKIKELQALNLTSNVSSGSSVSKQESYQGLSNIKPEKVKEELSIIKQSSRAKKPNGSKNINRPRKVQSTATDEGFSLEEKESTGRQATIHSLAREGRSVNEIARLLQMGQGEVELILGLRSRGD
ncbi:MAG: hypothetical protein M0Z31_03230 [Clostridia bacterium]|nr:hypothetical protein [Clostridia bacterium]